MKSSFLYMNTNSYICTSFKYTYKRGEYNITRSYKTNNRVIDYINSNLNRQISIDELSSLVDISTYHFHRIFTASMAEPVGKYILRRRLERAANVLLSDPAAIKDVAYDWGFSSASSFCRSFKRHFGISAEEYRRKNGYPDSKKCQFRA